MENLTTDFEKIEQELQELRSRFSRADLVLGELEEIQVQFEGLAETHHKLKEYVAEVSQFNVRSGEVIALIEQTHNRSEEHLVKLRDTNHLQLDEINARVSASEDNLNMYGLSIQTLQSVVKTLEQDFATKKRDLEHIFTNFDAFKQEIDFIGKNFNQLKQQIKITKVAIIILIGIDLLLAVWLWLK